MALINTTTTGAGVLGSTVYGDGQGALTVQKDGVTQGIYGNIPAFRAYVGTSQNISNATYTKVQLNTKLFDTNSNFDNVANYRYTPTISGYYQINGSIYANYTGSAGVRIGVNIYKNGSLYNSNELTNPSASVYGVVNTSGLVYMNGTTDYVELYALIYATGPQILAASYFSFMDGFLAKAA